MDTKNTLQEVIERKNTSVDWVGLLHTWAQKLGFVMDAEVMVRELAEEAGITINGNAPSDIRILDDRFYQRLVADGSLGLGGKLYWEVGGKPKRWMRSFSKQWKPA